MLKRGPSTWIQDVSHPKDHQCDDAELQPPACTMIWKQPALIQLCWWTLLPSPPPTSSTTSSIHAWAFISCTVGEQVRCLWALCFFWSWCWCSLEGEEFLFHKRIYSISGWDMMWSSRRSFWPSQLHLKTACLYNSAAWMLRADFCKTWAD